jgi:hypothetical protein
MEPETMSWPAFRRSARRFFGGPTVGRENAPGLFGRISERFARARMLVRAFYAFTAFLSIQMLPDWSGQFERGDLFPLWPVAWLPWVPHNTGILIVLGLHLMGPLLAMLRSDLRWTRILCFLGFLEWNAFNNSFGKIGHSLHLVVLLSFLWIFLPKNWHRVAPGRDIQIRTLHGIWGAQAVILLTYTMAGLVKVVAGLYQLSTGQVSVFHPQALAWHTAQRLWQTNSSAVCGEWLVLHPWVGWPLMLGTVYLELFSFWILFRPQWQKIWAAVLILFHIGSYFTMTIIFPQNCFFLGLFFVQPLFLNRAFVWREDWKTLPLVDGVVRRIGKT